jgi:Ca2+-binding EF-hand superfamily protein
MRKVLMAAAGFVALAGAAGFALAQQGGNAPEQGRSFGVFRADANNDGTVTRAEFDANRSTRFDALDANDDGQLTREEMRAGRGERGERGHRRGGRHGRGMERADANNDGNITREEFLAGPTQMFARLDANSDGVITATERPQRRERGEGREGRRQLDGNNDGQISQSEFAAMGASRFDRLDANEDGRVTREEAEASRGRHHGRD